MSVRAKIKLSIEAIDDGDKNEVARGAMRVSLGHLHQLFNSEISLLDGTTDDKIDLVWSDTRTLANATSEDLDLAGGVTDIFGNTLTFVEVSHMFFFNHKTVAGDYFRIGPTASNGWLGAGTPFLGVNDRTIVRPSVIVGGVTYPGFAWWSAPGGYLVTAGSGDSLTVSNSGATSSNYSLIILGRSA
jgi:hypothetical protein